MTDPTIRPRLIDGEPICDGVQCPAYVEADTKDGGWCRALLEGRDYMGVEPQITCIPGLRRFLAEAREERDAARRLYCAVERDTKGEEWVRACAALHGWSYLYAPTHGGGEKGGGE